MFSEPILLKQIIGNVYFEGTLTLSTAQKVLGRARSTRFFYREAMTYSIAMCCYT